MGDRGSYHLFKISRHLNFGRSVCLSVEPGATDQREDFARVLPEAAQARQQRVTQFVNGVKEPVGKALGVFEDVPELLAGVEFGTVGRQG